MADTGLTEEYLHRIHEEVKRIDVKLHNGHPKDYAEYRDYAGQIRGLEEAERILHKTIKMYMELQDDV